jgi:hypothetical protein
LTQLGERPNVRASAPGFLAFAIPWSGRSSSFLGAAVIVYIFRRRTYDGDSFRLTAQHDVPEEFDELLRSVGPLRPQEGSSLRRLMDGEQLVQVQDLAAETLLGQLWVGRFTTRRSEPSESADLVPFH